MKYKVLLRAIEGGAFFWVGKTELKPCPNMLDNSGAAILTQDEADTQIDWYGKFGFELEWKDKLKEESEMNSEVVNTAHKIAVDAHKGQTRWSGEPYIIHPEAVADDVKHLGDEYEVVALLHDVIEDSDIGAEELRMSGIPDYLITQVQALTKTDDVSYIEYILNLRNPDNRLARIVKIADIKHNLFTSDPKRTNSKGKGGKSIRDKWELALWILEKTGNN